MPLPKPQAGEKQSAFMERCMHEAMKGTDDQDQGVAMCLNAWRKGKEGKMATIEVEKRAFPVEFRVEGENNPKIRGYAALFNTESEEMFGFREKIAPGAFKKTLKEQDIRALFNHDPNIVLGRTGNGSLELREDDNGLFMVIDPPDTAPARDVKALIERGDVDQASFAFRVVKHTWDDSTKPPTRTLDEVTLYDVSVVTYPAYPQTSVDVRSFIVQGTNDSDEIRTAMDALNREPGDHSEEPEESTRAEPEATHSESVKVRTRKQNIQRLRHARRRVQGVT